MTHEAPTPDSPKLRSIHPLRALAVRIVRVVLLLYLGLLGVLYAFQTRLIFPGSATQGRPEARFEPPPGSELVTLTTERGDRVVALFGPALDPEGHPRSDAATCPSLIFFYGNAMCLRDALPEFDRFRRLGANVLIPDYVGYGLSGGAASETGCYATADAAFDHLRSRPDVDPGRIVVAGWSLGGAVAVDLASRRPVAGLIVLSSFTRVADLGRQLFPFLPVSLLLRHRFDSLAKIAKVKGPILIGHGRDDTLIPFAMADRLAAAVGDRAARLRVEGADHNEFFALAGDTVFQAIGRFLRSLDLQPQIQISTQVPPRER